MNFCQRTLRQKEASKPKRGAFCGNGAISAKILRKMNPCWRGESLRLLPRRGGVATLFSLLLFPMGQSPENGGLPIMKRQEALKDDSDKTKSEPTFEKERIC
jgi:hypothetical protein